MLGCSPDVEVAFDNLSADIEASGLTVVRDNVIACAASSPDDPNEVFVFAYLRPGATNLKLYASIDTSIEDKNDFSNYQFTGEGGINDFFNGFLKQYILDLQEEIWVIVSFEEDGQIHTSTPIRLKQLEKPTVWSDQISVDQSESLMPEFSWDVISDSAIYFHVVSDINNNALSGTYTIDTTFQYYKLDNVVLNVTIGAPPALIPNDQYQITVMGVSGDNWVGAVQQKVFTAE